MQDLPQGLEMIFQLDPQQLHLGHLQHPPAPFGRGEALALAPQDMDE